MEMECFESDPLADEYEADTDDDESLVTVESSLESMAENAEDQHGKTDKNINKLDDDMSDSNDTTIR